MAVVALIFTFTACTNTSELEKLQQQMEDMQSRFEQQIEEMQSQLEQQEDKLTELEIKSEIYRNLENFKDYPKEFDLKIVEDCFAFSFGSSHEVPYWEFLQIPDGVAINSEEGIEKLANVTYDYAPEKKPYGEAAEFLRLLKTEHFFDGYSFVITIFIARQATKSKDLRPIQSANIA